jgi:N-acetylglucosaminyl-diphospho-decaprenol L-rhamnosyltransferase
MTISIVIVTYNSEHIIQQTLNSILSEITDQDIEIIVVDNNSQDETVDVISRNFPIVKLIKSQENLGYGRGNNLGVSHSNGEYLVIVNPDVALSLGAVLTMVDFLNNHPLVGMVGPRTVDSDGNISYTARPNYTVARISARYLGLTKLWPRLAYGKYLQLIRQTVKPFDADWLQGSCFVIRREIYQQVKGFDDNFFLFMEDVDLCDRIWQSGWRITFHPNAKVSHIGSESVSRFPVTRIRSYHISPLYYFRKRNKPNAVLMLKIAFIVELTSKSLIRHAQNLLKADPRRLEKARIEWKTILDVLRY